ncbi:MAG TPA: ATP-binding protein, partial [Rhizomicrobium sp.]|nr:ATP-binding protein [Rhizomicrobium sp.]
VGITQTAQSLSMEVRDDGAGIPAEDLKRLGQPFEQVTQDSRLARGGTGLGLALVHGLAAKHGGAVKIDSILGEGTTVRVTLPRHAATAEAVRCLA